MEKGEDEREQKIISSVSRVTVSLLGSREG